jgi:hypothetical protein
VFLWNMLVTGTSSIVDPEEVSTVEWVTVERLSETQLHKEEKRMVTKANGTVAGELPAGRRAWVSLQRTLHEIWPQSRYERLEGTLRTTEFEIQRRVCEGFAAAADDTRCSDTALALLTGARLSLERFQFDQAWKLLHAARRMEINLVSDGDERKAIASAMREESSKIGSWRQKAMERLLGTPECPKDVKKAELVQAAAIRDEQYDNQGYKDQLARTQNLALAVILGFLLIAGFVLVVWGDRLMTNVRTLMFVVLFGLFGATISAMTRAFDTSQSARIPELTAALRVMFMRILMGSATAVVIYVFVRSGLADSFFGEWFKSLRKLEPYSTYAVAFISGTSERLVMKAVEQVAGKA